MSLSSIDRIHDVVTSVQIARFTQEKDMYTEYERSSNWLSEVAKMVKRKMMESCSLERAVKKLKLTKISEEDDSAKENSSPNEVIASSNDGTKKSDQRRNTYELNEYISNLNVATLRSELRSRGLVTYGLKRDLQERLYEALKGNENSDHFELIEILNEDDEPSSQEDPSTLSNIIVDVPSTTEKMTLDVQPIQEESLGTYENRNKLTIGQTDVSMQIFNDINHQHGVSKEHTEDLMMESTKTLEPIDEEKSRTSSPSLSKADILHSKSSDVQEQLMQSPSKITFGEKFLMATSKLFSPSKSKTSANNITSPDTSVKLSILKIEKNADASLSHTFESIPTSIHSIQGNTQMDIEGGETNLSNVNKVYALDKRIGKTPESLHSTNTVSTQSQSIHGSTSDASGRSSQSSLVMEKSKALAEARKARLAEMREKTKAAAVNHPISVVDQKNATIISIAPVTNATATTPVITVKNPRPQLNQDANEDRKKALAAQMREKAAAAARKLAEENAKVAAMIEIPVSSQKTEPSSIKSPHPQPRTVRETSAKKKTQKQQAALSPLDTYDMSDREDDSDDEDEDDRRKEDKRIPDWAQKSNLIPALERQFLEGPDRIDPDTIFPEVATCDLEAIFDRSKARYNKRTSSGNWTKDRVTASETLVYKRTMGFK